MKRILISILIAASLFSEAYAEESSVIFSFISRAKEVRNLELGVSTSAQDTFDLYDNEQPPFTPPGSEAVIPLTTVKKGVYGGEQNYATLNVDIRFAELGIEIEKIYRFDLLGTYDQVPWEIRWFDLPDEIKSGTIRDIYLGEGQYQYEIDILSQNELEVDKPIQTWEIVLKWLLEPAGFVESDNDIDGLPTPYKIINSDLIFEEPHRVTIYGLKGSTLMSIEGTIVETEQLPAGAYIIVSEKDGQKYIDKYIR